MACPPLDCHRFSTHLCRAMALATCASQLNVDRKGVVVKKRIVGVAFGLLVSMSVGLVFCGEPAMARPAQLRDNCPPPEGGRNVVTTATPDVTCTSVYVTSTKDLSNVVLVFEDGAWVKYDNLRETCGTFPPEALNTHERIWTVYVKSGHNLSGDGPGFGEKHIIGSCGLM